MKINIKKVLYRIIAIVIGLLIADYCTYFIQVTSQLSTYEKWIILSLYALLAIPIVSYFFFRNESYKGVIKNKVYLVISVVASIAIMFLGSNYFMAPEGRVEDVVITALEEKADESLGKEVWLTDIVRDGNVIPLDEIVLNTGWILKDGCLLATNTPAELHIPIYMGRRALISFVKHNYSGKVKITVEGKSDVIDLYSAEGDSYTYELVSNKHGYGIRCIESLIIIEVIMLYVMSKIRDRRIQIKK